MKKWVGWVLLAITLVLAFQGYVNAQNDPKTEELSREAAQSVDTQAIIRGAHPVVVKTDIVRRRYEWQTTEGSISVVCMRSAVFFGNWSCTAQEGSL
jgi:hypothetical protein